jgi:hypothetical protein
MTEPSTERLNELIRFYYNGLDDQGAIAVRVNDLAWSVYEELDPGHIAPGLVEWAAMLELRQLSRAICRARQSHSEDEPASGSLFDFELQPRYPRGTRWQRSVRAARPSDVGREVAKH